MLTSNFDNRARLEQLTLDLTHVYFSVCVCVYFRVRVIVRVSEEARRRIPTGALPPEHKTLGIGCETNTNNYNHTTEPLDAMTI